MSKAVAANTTIPSEIPELKPVEYQGVRVMTTEQLASAYKAAPIRLQQNHARNPDKFEEGRHFFKLTGSDLRDFKDRLSQSELVGARARGLILWTERGCLRHAKLLETPKAWEVFGQLEESYFIVKAAAQAPALPSNADEMTTRMFGILKQMNHRSAEMSREIAELKDQSREVAVLREQINAVIEVVTPSVPGVFRAGKTPGAILKSEGFENCPPGTSRGLIIPALRNSSIVRSSTGMVMELHCPVVPATVIFVSAE